ncbi:unnamed protein product [Spirodela intermedia]|uniref:Bulb-type lectin domain-containing protein n=1 Tax=Spirodela intermedia TaxID=51605 RepID=A0A7I8JGZ1_SPIIN|nr:unnamed protein product [Spirodela intermedia]CAA6669410.1 unnamed protein product [Spirodela intermedia]
MASRASCFLLLAPALLCLLSSPCVADSILYSDSSLYTGQSLNYGSYYLTMQSDCNLVLYDAGRALWATNTDGRGSNCRAAMQKDGNSSCTTETTTPCGRAAATGERQLLLILRSATGTWSFTVALSGLLGSNAYGTGVTISRQRPSTMTPQRRHRLPGGSWNWAGRSASSPTGIIS